MFEAESHGILVRVAAHFLDDESSPDDNRYIWAYRVEITNQSDREVQLCTRHWEIIDATGHREEVDGRGVVGKEPTIGPGQMFEYASGCPLPTPTGFMGGHYGMVGADGESFDIAIPTFSLDSPHADTLRH